jgi:hypothetical protein
MLEIRSKELENKDLRILGLKRDKGNRRKL